MQTLEIPVVTPFQEVAIVGFCTILSIAVIWWMVPKFVTFWREVSCLSPVTSPRVILGFLFYSLVFVPVVLASMVAVQAIGTPPTVVSPSGITGSTFACSSAAIFLSCSFPLRFHNVRSTIRWEDIQRVDCGIGKRKAIQGFHIEAAKARLEIGNAAVPDLSDAYRVILEHSPQGTVTTCQSSF